MSEQRLRLGEILVRAGLLDETRLAAALAEQKKWGGRLGRLLVDMGFVDEPTVVAALSKHLALRAIDIEATPPPLEVVQHLSVQYCERYGLFPLGADATRRLLLVATSDPTNLDSLRAVELKTGLHVEAVVAGAKDIDRAIRRYYYGEAPSTRTVVPADFGVEEQNYGPMPGPLPAPVAPPAPEPENQAAPHSATEAQLADRVMRLEELVGRQARALRALVEMLVDVGTLDRADYVKRVRGDEP